MLTQLARWRILMPVWLLVTQAVNGQSLYDPLFVTFLAGMPADIGAVNGTGDQARFNQPWGVAVDDAGTVYVADTANHAVRRISAQGVVTTLAGMPGVPGYLDGDGPVAQFNRPTGIAVNRAGTVVFVADYNNQSVRRIAGGAVTTFAGSPANSHTQDAVGTAAGFRNPFGVALNADETQLFVTEQNNQTVRRIAVATSAVTTFAGGHGLSGNADHPTDNLLARFNGPRAIAVDAVGNVYVADVGNATVRRIAAAGGVTTVAGVAGTSGYADAIAGPSLFSGLLAMSVYGGPGGLAVDAAGVVFVTDQGGHALRRIDPDGSVHTLAGVAQTAGSEEGSGSDARFRFPAGVAIDSSGLLYVADTANHTIRVTDSTGTSVDCPQPAPLDAMGHLLVPDGLDPALIVYDEIDRKLGFADILYPDLDTTTDLWQADLLCEDSIGGEPPPDAGFDAVAALAELGLTGVTPEQLIAALESWNQEIADQALTEEIAFPSAGQAAAPYSLPVVPYCPDPTKKYAFGGRDIVFVHGLQLGHLFQKIAGHPGANTTWQTPTSFPGNVDNPEFYDGGYFKTVADDIWWKHIFKFLRSKGYHNRYLVVSYPCTQRLEVGAQAILTQIGDAMQFGTGVQSIQYVAAGETLDTSKFGTPSFVIVSHSTGTLLTDVAMTAAATNPNLGASHIPQMAKAHIAMDGVFSGSDLATAAIVVSGFISSGFLPWVCELANLSINAIDEDAPNLQCQVFEVFATSVLVDLVPLVSQLKWGDHVEAMPVRTMTLIGGHPTMLRPLKYLIMPGFDDGVTTINSQVANPNSRLLWPSGFRPNGTGLLAPYDMGLAGTGNGPQSGLMSPVRAAGYYRDQVGELFRIPPLLIAGGATPYLSPSGMRQSVGDAYRNTHFSTLNRYHNHFSFIQSASDHLTGYTGTIGFFGEDYFPTFFTEPNREESRVITDDTVYQPFAMVYAGDDGPLLTADCVPRVESWERGRYVRPISFKVFGRTYRWGGFWVWRRVYDLLEDWQSKMGCDFMYESVLNCPPLVLPACQPCSQPLVSIKNRVQVVANGAVATLSASVSGSSPLALQWFRNGLPLADGAVYSGVTSPTLIISNFAAGLAGNYLLVAVNDCGQSPDASVGVSLAEGPPGTWQNSIELLNGTFRSPWLGVFKPVSNEWIHHFDHGWLYADAKSDSAFWLFDAGRGVWWWSGSSVFPYGFLAGHGWQYADHSSSPGNRFFYDFRFREWLRAL
jgi:sugar lactone lactonase YvrE